MSNDLGVDVELARSWWSSLRADLPAGLAGLWFGIFSAVMDGREAKTLYVAGTPTFDADDETAEWAVGPYAWEPAGRYVSLPGLAALPDEPLEGPLAHAAAVVRETKPWVGTSLGVAVGYDDGDFEVLHGA